MGLADFLKRLDAVAANGNSYMACCPAHDDRNPSLSISEGEDGRILVKCFAGCFQEDVVQALGLSMADLFEDNGRATHGRPVFKKEREPQPAPEPERIDPQLIEHMHQALPDKARDYLKRERMLSDEIINRYKIGYEERDGEKRITIPIADEQGIYRDVRRWLPPEYRTEDSAKILHWRTGYGALRLFPIDQLQVDELVLCEGELDALALISHSIPAITATCGVSTWPNSLSERFKAKQVTILLDHDEAGEKGTQRRAEGLSSCGAVVKVARWPEVAE